MAGMLRPIGPQRKSVFLSSTPRTLCDAEASKVHIPLARGGRLILHPIGTTLDSCHPTGIHMVEPRSAILQGTSIPRSSRRWSRWVLYTATASLAASSRSERRRSSLIRGRFICAWCGSSRSAGSLPGGGSESNRKAKFYVITKAGRAQLKAETENWEVISAPWAACCSPRVACRRSPGDARPARRSLGEGGELTHARAVLHRHRADPRLRSP